MRRVFLLGIVFLAARQAHAIEQLPGFDKRVNRHIEVLLGASPEAFTVEVTEVRGAGTDQPFYYYQWHSLRDLKSNAEVARYYIRAWVIATAEDGSTSTTPLDRAAVGDSEDSPLLEAMSPVKGDGIPDHYIENHAEGLRILSPNGVIIAQEPKYFRVSDVSVVGKTSEALFYSGQIIENGTPLEIVRAIVFPR